ncbi:tyrosine-type recombinase/integrase [Eubacterium ramulus]|uniref:tyrosine-type recombinase/integrase n=1 Tax=Eubacterium ramulus TaxID=39490 RepID=UPI00399A5439
MGKSLKGKELGTGISQRKDGLYSGRVTDKNGKRVQKYFKKLANCRKWVADTQYEVAHGNALYSENPIFEKWFWYWLENIKSPNIKDSTMVSYISQGKNNILPIIGNMTIQEIKPLHCTNVLTTLANKNRANGFVKQARMIMYACFESAVENAIIQTNPVTKNVKVNGTPSKHKRSLTIQEQKDFLQRMVNCAQYNEFSFILQTGMRIGEVIALTWDDVDFDKKVLHVTKNIETSIKHSQKLGTPKTKSSIRDIPLTDEAIQILKKQRNKNSKLKVINIQYKNNIFLNKSGNISPRATYRRTIKIYCEKYNIEPFSTHSLRHTFATRCIEAGMKPKTLQHIMGHSTITTTMDLYVDLLDDERGYEIEKVQKYLNIG